MSHYRQPMLLWMNALGNCHNGSALEHSTTNGNHHKWKSPRTLPLLSLIPGINFSTLMCVWALSLLASISYKCPSIPNSSFSWKSPWYVWSLEHGSPITGACNGDARAGGDPHSPCWDTRWPQGYQLWQHDCDSSIYSIIRAKVFGLGLLFHQKWGSIEFCLHRNHMFLLRYFY